ncbi:hypothetical protein IFM89_012824 [Coptis chinensis]|uniref:ABC transporter domain-containing protein n=1 Tax=Coptis chinensis TaxID=261450 RepID=A0A835H611_9MAGN|nr:hypothetical protein IFM89_012824 [Coptis chinensis]
MVGLGVKPDKFTYPSVFKACGYELDLGFGKEVHKCIEGSYIEWDLFVQNALVTMYVKCGCIYLDLYDEALFIFREMLLTGIKPNYVTIASILPFCGRRMNVLHGKEIHCYIMKKIELKDHLLLWNSLLDLYSKSGKMLEAQRIFDSMSVKDKVTYTSLIAGYGMQGRGHWALKLFDEMNMSGIEADHITMVAVLSACSHSGLVDEGQMMFAKMINVYRINPRIEHFSCMVDLFGNAGLLRKAVQIITEMPYRPSHAMLATLVSASRIYGNTTIMDWATKMLEGNTQRDILLEMIKRRAQSVNLDMVEVKINKMMPELGFSPEDSDRLVALFSSGWQMRMSLGKILLQDPDLLLLDEPTNHLDLDTIEWLEAYLNKQDVPMVIISQDRAFLDQLCNKIVETDMGVSRTYAGNYSQYIASKAAWFESQYIAWEKQQRQIDQTRDIISRLSTGANAGRASTAEKAEALDLDKTVLETVEEVAEDWRLDDIKGLLGRCNFKADMLDRKVSLLSGGEKEAISEYEGTVITVSHDQYFIKQIVNRVVEVKDNNLQDYAGDYNYYLEKNLDAREKDLQREAELEEKAPKVKAKSKMSKAEKEAQKKQKRMAFQNAKQKSKGLKNVKRWN